MLRNRRTDQVGGLCAAGLSLYFRNFMLTMGFLVWQLSLSQGMAITAVSGAAP